MKKTLSILLALTLVFSLAACGSSGGAAGSKTPTTTETGEVVTAEIPEGWRLVTGTEACGDRHFDFIYCSDDEPGSYFTVFHDTQEVEHYKDMIATGNYGKDLGTAELGEGTWYIAEKVAAGPIGEDSCVIQAYNCDLGSAEVQAVLASLKWVA